MIKALVIFTILMLVYFRMYFQNIGKASKEAEGYYEEKCRKYPWLVEHFKQNGYTVKNLAGSDVDTKVIIIGAVCVAITFAGGWLLNLITSAIFDGFMAALLGYAASALALVVAILVARKMWNSRSGKKESEKIGGECPECGCPLAMVVLKEQNIVEGERIKRETTTTTTTRSADSYGGGLIGGMFAGAGSSKSTYTKETICYDGRSVRELKCRNCDHSYQDDSAQSWEKNRPNEQPQIYNPPKDVFTPETSNVVMRWGKLSILVFWAVFLGVITMSDDDALDKKAFGRAADRTAAKEAALFSETGAVRINTKPFYTEGMVFEVLDNGKKLPEFHEIGRSGGWKTSQIQPKPGDTFTLIKDSGAGFYTSSLDVMFQGVEGVFSHPRAEQFSCPTLGKARVIKNMTIDPGSKQKKTKLKKGDTVELTGFWDNNSALYVNGYNAEGKYLGSGYAKWSNLWRFE